MLDLTALVLTADEEPNISRTLARLTWLREVVVLDSGSTDQTKDIVASYPNTRFIEHQFDDLTSQWTFGLTECGIESEWVLTLDADYCLTTDLIQELQGLQPAPELDGWSVDFDYAVFGRVLRGSLYPPRTVVLRRTAARFIQDGHTQVVRVPRTVGRLRRRIVHDDRKPAHRWLQRQARYMADEADKLLGADRSSLGIPDRLRLLLVAPFVVFAYTLLAKGCVFDGWPGLYYTVERTIAECILTLELLRRKISPDRK